MDAFYVINLGEIALDQGHLDEAERALTSVLRTWRAAGYRSGTGYAEGQAGPGRHRAAPVRRCTASLRGGDRGAVGRRQSGRGARGPGRPRRMPAPQRRRRRGPLAGRRDDQLRPRPWVAWPLRFHPSIGCEGRPWPPPATTTALAESLHQSLRAAEVREAEYEAALTLRVLATIEADPYEKEVLARSAAADIGQAQGGMDPGSAVAGRESPVARLVGHRRLIRAMSVVDPRATDISIDQ